MTTRQRSVIPESHRDLLREKVFAHVATIGPHGEPQSTPVWIDWDGTSVRFSQTKARQKLHNLQRDPHIALSMTDPTNPYRYLELRGVVTRIEDDPQNAFIDKLAKKYMGKDRYPYHQPGDERVVVTVTPQHTTHMG